MARQYGAKNFALKTTKKKKVSIKMPKFVKKRSEALFLAPKIFYAPDSGTSQKHMFDGNLKQMTTKNVLQNKTESSKDSKLVQ